MRNAWNLSKRVIGRGILLSTVVLGVPGLIEVALAQQNRSANLDVLKIRPNFYMIAGAGGNISVQMGSDGVVLVDAGSGEASTEVLAAIQKLTDQPIRYIIDTDADSDQVGGNASLAKAGRSIFDMGTAPLGGQFASTMTNGFAASILAADNVLVRMSAPTGQKSPYPSDAWPTDSLTTKRNYIYFNHEGIEIFYEPAAHSDGDSIVFFRASDVVATGDILDATRFPVINLSEGGSIQGEVDALNHVVELSVQSIPFVNREDGTYIIPGHGRIFRLIDVVEYRDMIVTIRDIIQDMIQRDMTLDQIEAASPAKAYESEYGSNSGPWTTNDFVRAVYESLTRKK